MTSKVALSPEEIIKIDTEYDKKIAEIQRKFSGRKITIKYKLINGRSDPIPLT